MSLWIVNSQNDSNYKNTYHRDENIVPHLTVVTNRALYV